jgi:hypothetical protein
MSERVGFRCSWKVADHAPRVKMPQVTWVGESSPTMIADCAIDRGWAAREARHQAALLLMAVEEAERDLFELQREPRQTAKGTFWEAQLTDGALFHDEPQFSVGATDSGQVILIASVPEPKAWWSRRVGLFRSESVQCVDRDRLDAMLSRVRAACWEAGLGDPDESESVFA